MTLYEKLFVIYPKLKSEDFIPDKGLIALRNDSDGEGDYIFEWNHPTLNKPTQEQLNLVV